MVSVEAAHDDESAALLPLSAPQQQAAAARDDLGGSILSVEAQHMAANLTHGAALLTKLGSVHSSCPDGRAPSLITFVIGVSPEAVLVLRRGLHNPSNSSTSH